MPALTRNERLVLMAITAGGIALRCQGLGELSLAHFDEGVLLSGAFDVRLQGLWHFTLAQPLQAPPLFPWLVGGLMWLTGIASPLVGVYTSALFGSATIPLFFLLARRWSGNRVGLIAAGLLATSDLHVAFSRMALTEAALTFWFVLAMYALTRLADAAAKPAASTGRICVWAVAAGLATGAAWNTKYNGWMPLAIAVTAWFCAAARRRLFSRSYNVRTTEPVLRTRLWAALLLAAAIAVACFLPWYRYVEQSFPGGYAAITQNHLNYVGGLSDWPERAGRLLLSLSAFRHGGWLLTVVALLFVLIWRATTFATQPLPRSPSSFSVAALALGVLAAVAAVALGSDAMCLLIATAAILPALIWGRLEQIVAAVWVGAFIVLTPFYHPYTRLLVPALPGAIALTCWLLSTVFHDRTASTRETALPAGATHRVVPSPHERETCVACLAASMIAGSAIALATHPFGWLPTAALWHRWSTRQSYRAFNDAVREHTPPDAHVLCQGMPIMPLYLERRWDSLGHVPFTAWMGHVPADRPCYLAVDSWGIYGEHHEAARHALAEHLDGLQPVAWVENDLNVVTLLDYLPAAGVAQRISRDLPALRWLDRHGRPATVPADLRDAHANLIVLYRIDRARLHTVDEP